MPRGDPTLIVRFRRCTARDGGAIGAQDGHLIARIDAFASRGGFAGAGGVFTASGAAFLGEEGGDPGAVDEVTCAAEDGGEEEVEEEAVERGEFCVSFGDEEEEIEGPRNVGGLVFTFADQKYWYPVPQSRPSH